MNFIDYTLELVNELPPDRIALVVGAGFKVIDNRNVKQNDPEMDLNEWIEAYRNNRFFQRFDKIILSRVLEHFPQRSVDWYLYNIYTILQDTGQLICVVPDMKACSDELAKEFKKKTPDMFKVNRLTYELLSEGDHVWDRHSTWTCENSVKKYLEMEGLFEVINIERIRIDSDIVPEELEITAIRR